ncbi:zinc-binding dehydrogenase [Methylocucumis oryzae]|uniref:zinc-binding dehydrogenase n=1 Tax=Methylocucumis oryzae TaxID=1632867 RepID=UPI000AE0DF90
MADYFQRGGLRAGETVLIHAGAGGVGSVAIPLAKIAGAKVITTVSSQEKADWVKQLGADAVVFYQQQDLISAVNAFTDGQGVDLTFDTVGPDVFAASIPATKHFGRLVTLLDPGLVNLAEARIRNLLIGFELMLTPMLRDLPTERDNHMMILNQCKTYLEQGLLPACRIATLPLSDAACAHRTIEAGHTLGKLVLVN